MSLCGGPEEASTRVPEEALCLFHTRLTGNDEAPKLSREIECGLHSCAPLSFDLEISSYLLCLTAATRSGPENMENKLSPLAEDVSSLELAESP